MCIRTHGRTESGSVENFVPDPVCACGWCRVPYAHVRDDARSQVISYVLSPINYVLGVEDQPKDGGAAARRFVNQFEAKVRHAELFCSTGTCSSTRLSGISFWTAPRLPGCCVPRSCGSFVLSFMCFMFVVVF